MEETSQTIGLLQQHAASPLGPLLLSVQKKFQALRGVREYDWGHHLAFGCPQVFAWVFVTRKAVLVAFPQGSQLRVGLERLEGSGPELRLLPLKSEEDLDETLDVVLEQALWLGRFGATSEGSLDGRLQAPP